MLISCKCLNFIATTSNALTQKPEPQQQIHKKTNSDLCGVDNDRLESAAEPSTAVAAADGTADLIAASKAKELAQPLMDAFLQRYSRKFIFYSQFMDFFKNIVGPVTDLSINNVAQRNLIYSLTLDIALTTPLASTWQLSICVNCNSPLCAKRLVNNSSPTYNGGAVSYYLINNNLRTTDEKLAQLRADKSFSDTFGLLILDHQFLPTNSSNVGRANNINGANGSGNQGTTSSLSLSSTTSFSSTSPLDFKVQRLRQLQQHLQVRLKQEYSETEERIQKYTEQQFALLKSFREKSEQEYKLLEKLLQCIPEQGQQGQDGACPSGGKWEELDRSPPALEVCAGFNYTAARRRNTVTSRRDLTAPTTPTTSQAPASTNVNHNSNTNNYSAINESNNTSTLTVAQQQQHQRKMANFDTPPATPEAAPMSVGNSPTRGHHTFLQITNNNTSLIDNGESGNGDDCLFDLDGMDTDNHSFSSIGASTTVSAADAIPILQPTQVLERRRNAANVQIDDSDEAEEAEDAIDLDRTTIATENRGIGIARSPNTDLLNFAKSLPIGISNSPMAQRYYMEDDSNGDELDTTVDIAASIKALAKSVHGEAVFGDLPRPRLRSQI